MNLCLNCGKETNNPKFCSRSCAAIYNNTHREKVKKYCKKCGILIGEGTTFRRLYCDNCSPNKKDWTKISLKDVQDKKSYQVNSRIRTLARAKTEQISRFKKCAVCGYDKHVEICHIKPIKDFDENALIEEINSLDNLIGLCPNHHWELDNNIISIEDIL